MKKIFTFLVIYRTALLLVTILLVISFLSYNKIHGSSIGVYNLQFYGQDFKDKNVLFGTPRTVRSDEWMVTSPLAISQSYNNFSSFSVLSNGGQELSIPLDIPTNHWSTIFKPANFPFFILPLENAFAMRWWLRGTLLLLAFYTVLMMFTKRDFFVSLGGSLIVFFSPFIQWWYSGSGSALEVTTYGMLIIGFSTLLINSKNVFFLIVYSLLLIYVSVSFVLTLYPPFQIAMLLLIITFNIGYILQNRSKLSPKKIRSYLICLSLVFISMLLIITIFYVSLREVIDAIMNTSYPGKRISSGGDYSLIRFFSGFFNSYFLDKTDYVPSVFINKSEGSSFLMFYPFLFPIILFAGVRSWYTKNKLDYILNGLSLYLGITTFWLFFGLPTFISKIMLLHLVTENRMILGIGITNYLLCFFYLKNFNDFKRPTLIIYAFISAIIAAIIHLILSYNLIQSDYFYFKSDYLPILGNYFKIILISLTVFLSVYCLIAKHKKLFISLVLIYSIFSSLTVNPLYQGLSPIIKNGLATQLQLIEKIHPDDHWIVYDNLYISNFLTANGIKTITGVSMYPKFELWQKLDPHAKYTSIYNRYGHISFTESPKDEISFKLVTPDYFAVKIDPCRSELSELKVSFVVFHNLRNYPCLRFVKSFTQVEIPFYVYQRI